MKDRVFKVVWVDGRGRLWSVMKGAKGFYSRDNQYAKKPVSYRSKKETTPRADDKPYLFAFASVTCAMKFVANEFGALNERHGAVKVVKDTEGHVEIWEAEGETVELPDLTKLTGTEIGPDFYDAYVRQGAPRGTVFCKSIKLVSKVTNLL